MGVNSLTRIRDFSPDSMSYVDVARNFVSGRGLSQSSLGFGRARFSPDDPIPAPFTAHAPGFSVLIALTALTGLSFTDAALLLPIVFLAACLAAAFLLARACYDEGIAWLSVAALLNYYPLRHVAAVAWSETTATFFVLITLWFLVRSIEETTPLRLCLAGVCAGLAVTIRYPMLPIVGVAALTLSVPSARMPRLRDRALWLIVGVAVGAGPMLARNVLVSGSIAGSAPNPVQTPLLTNFIAAAWSLAEYYRAYYLELPPRVLEMRIAVASLAAAAVVLAWQRRLRDVVADVFVRRGSVWVGLWAVAYLGFLVVTRSITWFDDINHRLTVEAGVCLVLLWIALAVKTVRANFIVCSVVAAGLLFAGIAREVRFFREHAPVVRDAMPPTPRLLWIKARTTERDLIIGDYTLDISFFLDGRRTITFEHYPYTMKPTRELLSAYVRRHCREYEHVYLIVKDWHGGDHYAWRRSFGPFIAELATTAGRYPEYTLVERLADSFIFRVTPDCR